MSKNLTRGTNWNARVSEYSTRSARNGANLLGWDKGREEYLTAEQERAALVAKVKRLDEALACRQTEEHRRILGREKFDLQNRINYLRPKMQCKGIENYIIDVLRRDMSKPQFDRIMQEAKKLHAADMKGDEAAKID